MEIEKKRRRRDDSDSDDDRRELDVDFMEKYRAARLGQIKYGTHFPTYGEIREVDAFEYADEIDNTDERSMVVVHMYEPYVPACKMINKYVGENEERSDEYYCYGASLLVAPLTNSLHQHSINRYLEELARRLPYAKFLRLHAFKANSNLDPVALPIIMIHRGGELIHNLVRVSDDLPKDFLLEDLKDLLENCGVLDPTSEDNARGAVRKTERQQEEEEEREIAYIENALQNADWGQVNNGGGKQVIGNLYDKNRYDDVGYRGEDSDSDDLDGYLDGYDDNE